MRRRAFLTAASAAVPFPAVVRVLAKIRASEELDRTCAEKGLA
jgi:hypothetical protein